MKSTYVYRGWLNNPMILSTSQTSISNRRFVVSFGRVRSSTRQPICPSGLELLASGGKGWPHGDQCQAGMWGPMCILTKKNVTVGGIGSSNITGLVGIHKNKRDFTIRLVRKCLSVSIMFSEHFWRESNTITVSSSPISSESLSRWWFPSDALIYKIWNKQTLGDSHFQ